MRKLNLFPWFEFPYFSLDGFQLLFELVFEICITIFIPSACIGCRLTRRPYLSELDPKFHRIIRRDLGVFHTFSAESSLWGPITFFLIPALSSFVTEVDNSITSVVREIGFWLCPPTPLHPTIPPLGLRQPSASWFFCPLYSCPSWLMPIPIVSLISCAYDVFRGRYLWILGWLWYCVASAIAVRNHIIMSPGGISVYSAEFGTLESAREFPWTELLPRAPVFSDSRPNRLSGVGRILILIHLAQIISEVNRLRRVLRPCLLGP